MLFTQRVFCCLTPNRLKDVLTLTNEMSSEMALIRRRVWDNSIVGNNGGYLGESDCPAIFVVERQRPCAGLSCGGVEVAGLAIARGAFFGGGGERIVPDSASSTVAASCLRCA